MIARKNMEKDEALGSNHEHVLNNLLGFHIHKMLKNIEMIQLQCEHLSSKTSSTLFIFQTKLAQRIEFMSFNCAF